MEPELEREDNFILSTFLMTFTMREALHELTGSVKLSYGTGKTPYTVIDFKDKKRYRDFWLKMKQLSIV